MSLGKKLLYHSQDTLSSLYGRCSRSVITTQMLHGQSIASQMENLVWKHTSVSQGLNLHSSFLRVKLFCDFFSCR